MTVAIEAVVPFSIHNTTCLQALRFVYEEVCPACNGSGTTVSKAGRSRKGRGKRTVGACLRCAGVGVLTFLSHVLQAFAAGQNTIAS